MTKAKDAANDNQPTFLGRLKAWLEYSSAVSSLNRLDDRTLADIGYTRQQVLNGDFFNKTDVVDFPAGNLGLEKSVKQDNKIEDKVAA